MTTLAKDAPLTIDVGDIGSIPIIASDIVYQSAMVGDLAGYGRPLVAGDRFRGHAIEKCDNSASAVAGAKNILVRSGRYKLAVAIAAVYITDVGLPVYASDDSVCTMVGANASGPNSYVGVLDRYIDATHGVVEFRPGEVDEFGNNLYRVLKSDDYTSLLADGGKIIYVDTDTKIVTLCIGTTTLGGYVITIVNAAGDGLALVVIDPNAADLISGGCDLGPGGDGKKFSNTKATARRGDYLKLIFNASTGWNVIDRRGTWAIET